MTTRTVGPQSFHSTSAGGSSNFMRLRPSALERPRTADSQSGPQDLRLALHAATTFGPRAPAYRRSAPGSSSYHALPGLDARAQERRQPRPVGRGVAERELVELGALHEEVQVVLPREADSAVHLERGA